MKYELEQQLRMEARHLRACGVLAWDAQLRANGLDPYRWSTGGPTGIPEPAGGQRAFEPGAIFRRAAPLSAMSFDATDNSVEVTWTTGAAVLRNGWDGTFSEVLTVTPEAIRLDRLNAGAPFLNSHQSGDLAMVLGAVKPGSARIASGKGTCRVALSDDPAKAGFVGDIKGGKIRNVSVGYRIFNTVMENANADIPVMRVTDWEPFEISAVAAGADPNAVIH